MIVRSFLIWTRSAPAAARAEGIGALARAYLADELDPGDRRDAETAMTALLDDGSPLVRMALARELAGAPAVPRHLLTGLLRDRSDIAAVVLRASPLLGEEELIEAVATGDTVAQAAVARRPNLPVGVAGAVAEVASLPACQALCLNETAAVAPVSLRRLLERFGSDPVLRDLLGCRPDIDAGFRHDLAVATARELARFVAGCGWLPADRAGRVAREASDQVAVTLAADEVRRHGAAGADGLVDHLQSAGRLTPALLLRSLANGDLGLFETAVSRLSGVARARVAGLLRGASGLGFAALYRKAGLPPALMPVFEAATREAARAGNGEPAVRRGLVGRVLAACTTEPEPEVGKAMAMLRALDAEAARADARAFADDLATDAAPRALPRPAREHPPLLTAA